MKKKIVSAFILVTMLLSQNAYAGINRYPEIDNLIETRRHEDVEAHVKTEKNVINQTAYTTVEIDENTLVGPSYPEVLGHGGEGFNTYSEICLNPDGTVSEEFQKLCDEKLYDTPVARFGGHNSNYVNLIDQIGPMSERKISTMQLTKEELDMFHPEAGKEELLSHTMSIETCGTVEFIKAMQAQNPDMQFIFVITLTHGSKEDAANFVRFCLDDPAESEWGKLRESYGLDKINILALELGNELYTAKVIWGEQATNERCTWYINKFKEFTEEIHKYYPEVETSPCLIGSCQEDGYVDETGRGGSIRALWNERIVAELGPDMKYYSMHLYYCGYEPAYCTDAYMYLENFLIEHFGENHGKQLLITEHAKWAAQTQFSTSATLESALSTAQYLNTLYGWNDLIRAATYYCFTSENQWALVRRNYDGDLVVSGVGQMYGVYLDAIGDRVVKTTSIPKDDTEYCDKSSTMARFSAQAFAEGDKTLKIVMTNRLEDVNIDVDFSFLKNKYTLKEETVFTAPNTLSFIYNKNTLDVFTTTTNSKNEANFNHYVMPNKSMVVLTLEANSTIPKIGGDTSTDEVVYEGEQQFNDIQYHWAENEINLLAQDGVVNGVGNGNFKPDAMVSRAEFATMLSKFFSVGTVSQGFNDVSVSDWYFKPVGTMYNMGYMQGYNGNFNPNGQITLKDAIITLYRICSSKDNDIAVSDRDEVIESLGINIKLSDWEKDAFAYAWKNKFLTKFYEVSDITLSEGLTRAETAVLIYRLKSNIGLSVVSEEVTQ